MPVQQGQDKVIIKHPKGPSVEILLYGATVISWKSGSQSNPQPLERLFVSSKAYLDGSKPVRGGIPVVFPCFGAPTHPDHLKLNQHGFARSEKWNWDGIVMDNDAGVSVKLALDPTTAIAAKYDKPFHLDYIVTLAEHQLSTDLHVRNTSPTATIDFQALFHNYFRGPSDKVRITPLHGTLYYDKTEATEEGRTTAKKETRQEVDVSKFTDYVYDNPPDKYELRWPGSCVSVRATNLKNLVIWNPQKGAGSKIGDMEEGGWENFVCVEPGFVRGFVSVKAGETWIGQQVLSVTN